MTTVVQKNNNDIRHHQFGTVDGERLWSELSDGDKKMNERSQGSKTGAKQNRGRGIQLKMMLDMFCNSKFPDVTWSGLPDNGMVILSSKDANACDSAAKKIFKPKI